MWTDRYKPNSVYDLVGNQGNVDSLYEWLKDWDDVVIRGNKNCGPPNYVLIENLIGFITLATGSWNALS